MNETPLYRHDCDRCVFLGCWTGPMSADSPRREDVPHDLYYADHGGSPDTVIARYGNNGPDYYSGMAFADSGLILPLVIAKDRAMQMGLMKVEGNTL